MSHVSLSVLSPRLNRASLGQKFATVAIGTLVLAIAARLQVPFWPVPMTLQTLAVLLIGVVTGPRLAAATIVAYVAEGAVGLPVLAHGGGMAALIGPTTGYIVGYLFAVILAGIGAQRGWMRSLAGSVATLVAADAVIFVCGLAWLAVLVGWSKAVTLGLVPFLFGEALKLALATAVTRVRISR